MAAVSGKLPIEALRAGTVLFRIHDPKRSPLWFGPAKGSPPLNRFDDGEGAFRVLYAGLTPACAFAEKFLRNRPVRVLSVRSMHQFSVASIHVVRGLRLAQVKGPGLARLGVTAAISNGPYEESQRLARTIWLHRDRLDGILYRARHDDDEVSVALFDRARDSVAWGPGDSTRLDAYALLPELLARYGLTP